MDLSILAIWMSPLSFLGALGVFSSFLFHFSIKFTFQANRIASDGTPRFAASDLGLFCLPMSHKKDARLIWVKKVEHSNPLNRGADWICD